LLREVERLQRELESERLARARVEGELAASAKVEAAAQRYADRAEAKLAEARREALSLARALGQVEQERDSSRAQLAGRRGFWARVTARN
jgi:chromosome segregation ATPase